MITRETKPGTKHEQQGDSRLVIERIRASNDLSTAHWPARVVLPPSTRNPNQSMHLDAAQTDVVLLFKAPLKRFMEDTPLKSDFAQGAKETTYRLSSVRGITLLIRRDWSGSGSRVQRCNAKPQPQPDAHQ